MSGLVYGIDFGTSNSAIMVGRPDGSVVRVKDPAAARGGWSVPTSVALSRDGSIAVGWAAERAKLARPESYRSEFKRDVGDPTPMTLGDRRFAAHELAGLVLGFLREQAAAQVPGDPEHVVITVPASWESGHRDLMLAAAKLAGFDPGVVSLETEPVAAAAAAFAESGAADVGTVLVYDLGGGTFDCAVARSGPSGLEVLGTPGGLSDVGGGAFDRAILADLRRRFPAECADLFAESADPAVLRRRLQLRNSSEEIKVQLSVVESTVAFLTELTPPVEVEYTRAQLGELLWPMLKETLTECSRMLDTLGLRWSDIDRIVPVGGSTRLSLVGELLDEHTEHPLLTVDDPALAIAGGAVRGALRPEPDTGPAAVTQPPVREPVAPPPEWRPWRTPCGGISASWPAVASDRVVIGFDQTLYALDTTTGRVVWSDQFTGGRAARPLVGVLQDRVVVGNREEVVCYDAGSGARLWHRSGESRGTGGIAVVNDVVCVSEPGYSPISVWAYSLFDGASLWHVGGRNTATRGGVLCAAPREGLLLQVTNGAVSAFDAADGSPRWTIGEATSTDPTYASNDVCVVGSIAVCRRDKDVRLHAFRIATGERLWTADESAGIDEIATTGSFVYLWAKRTVHAIDPGNGRTIWQSPKLPRTFNPLAPSSLAADGEIVCVTNGDGVLYAFNAWSGTRRWTFPVGRKSFGRPAIHEGRVYVGVADGTVASIDAATGQAVR